MTNIEKNQAMIDSATQQGFSKFAEFTSGGFLFLHSVHERFNIEFALFPPQIAHVGISEIEIEKTVDLWHSTKLHSPFGNIFDDVDQLTSYLQSFGPRKVQQLESFGIALKPMSGRQLRSISAANELHCHVENACFGLDDGPGLIGTVGLSKIVDASGFRVPSRAQWEFAARGGDISMLFPWGDKLEDAPSIVNAELNESEEVVAQKRQEILNRQNAFGFAQAAICHEWCSDVLEQNANDSKLDPRFLSSDQNHLVKGFGSDPGTWQHPDSWVGSLISTICSQEDIADQEQAYAAFRPVIQL